MVFTITVKQHNGQEVVVNVGNDKPLLLALEAVGCRAVPVGCRGGGCGICRIRIVKGEYDCKKMSRVHVSENDEANNMALACRTLPLSDLTIELATPEPVRQQQIATLALNDFLK